MNIKLCFYLDLQFGLGHIKCLIFFQTAGVTFDIGWYPELVFLSVLFSNSTISAVLIPNTSVFDTLFNLLL